MQAFGDTDVDLSCLAPIYRLYRQSGAVKELRLSEALVASLLAGKGLDHPVDHAELIETHISWVVLAGAYVYKLKKPVDLGFVDFSSLEKRKHFCEEELRLNRRTAPGIYQDVVPISGTEEAPSVNDDSAPIEYAVRMRRFEQSSILENLAKRGEFDAKVTTRLALAIAEFHKSIAGGADYPFDDVLAHVLKPADANFEHLAPLVRTNDEKEALARLKRWTSAEFERRRPVFVERFENGMTRECHGDLHLGNILYEDGACIPFDCLEFNPELRWIDTASDLAFTVMDIDSHGLHQHAHQLLIEYLEHTGDYGLLAVLRYYLVYRAVVRAKVDAIRSRQDASHSREFLLDCDNYLKMALGYTELARAAMVLMCGLSGSGKTTIARHIATEIGAIQIRSDIERKRLFGLEPRESSHEQALDIYTGEATAKTFSRLESLATQICNNDYLVIVDATFIDAKLRRRFEMLADKAGLPWCIIYCEASEEEIAGRLAFRKGDASEAGLAQYRTQKAAFAPFDENERNRVVTVDTESAESITTAARRMLKTLDG